MSEVWIYGVDGKNVSKQTNMGRREFGYRWIWNGTRTGLDFRRDFGGTFNDNSRYLLK